MKYPLVSVVITTKNSSETLEKLLKSIRKQSYKKIEIIVVDNSSVDETFQIAKKYTKLTFQKGPERSTQRNFGAKKSKGDYLLFLDSDMVLGKNVIKECVKKILDSSKNDLGGVVIPERSFGSSFWAKAKMLEREINLGEVFFEAARFFPKKVFWKLQGYDQNLSGPEDWDLPQRVAREYKIERIKSFILHNEGHLSLTTLFRKKYYYGLSVDKYLKKQKIPLISPTTMYFLRPAFYKKWPLLTKNPVTTFGMFIMLFVETIGGSLGYFVGKFKNE